MYMNTTYHLLILVFKRVNLGDDNFKIQTQN